MEKLTVPPAVITMYTTDKIISNSIDNLNNTHSKIRNVTDIGLMNYIPDVSVSFQHSDKSMTHVINNEVYNELNYIVHDKMNKVSRTNTILGSVTMILNFTNNIISVRDYNNIPKQIINIPTKGMYKNKIYVLTLHNLTNPNSEFFNKLETNNYLEALIINNKKSGNLVNDELIAIHDYYTKHFNHITEDITNPTLKVVIGYMLDAAVLETSKDKTVYLTNKDLVISLKNIIEIAEHPRTNVTNTICNTKDLKAIEDNTISFFIVDSKHKVTKKFFNIFNKPMEIPKISSEIHRDGLYLKGKLNGKLIEEFWPLEDLSEIKYVYNSEEEALLSGNAELHYKKEITKLENENKRLAIDLEKVKIDTGHKQLDIETTKLVKKDYYDTRKYERDNVLESLKVAGAIAGLVGGGIVLYSKFKK